MVVDEDITIYNNKVNTRLVSKKKKKKTRVKLIHIYLFIYLVKCKTKRVNDNCVSNAEVYHHIRSRL